MHQNRAAVNPVARGLLAEGDHPSEPESSSRHLATWPSLGDLDGDGTLDLVEAGFQGKAEVWLNRTALPESGHANIWEKDDSVYGLWSYTRAATCRCHDPSDRGSIFGFRCVLATCVPPSRLESPGRTCNPKVKKT